MSKQFEAGTWLISANGMDLILVHGYATDGRMITEREDGTVEADFGDWAQWRVVHGCTGFDWSSEAVSSRIRYYTCKESNEGVVYRSVIRRDDGVYCIDRDMEGFRIPCSGEYTWDAVCDKNIKSGKWVPVSFEEAESYLSDTSYSEDESDPDAEVESEQCSYVAAALTGLLANPNVVVSNNLVGFAACNTDWAGVVNLAREIGKMASEAE